MPPYKSDKMEDFFYVLVAIILVVQHLTSLLCMCLDLVPGTEKLPPGCRFGDLFDQRDDLVHYFGWLCPNVSS